MHCVFTVSAAPSHWRFFWLRLSRLLHLESPSTPRTCLKGLSCCVVLGCFMVLASCLSRPGAAGISKLAGGPISYRVNHRPTHPKTIFRAFERDLSLLPYYPTLSSGLTDPSSNSQAGSRRPWLQTAFGLSSWARQLVSWATLRQAARSCVANFHAAFKQELVPAV